MSEAQDSALRGEIPVIPIDSLDVEGALDREWLCTNGLGGYAMGSLAGANTRRYHGLLVAALAPPLGRTLLCAKVDETFDRGGQRVALGANEFRDGARAPWGVTHLSAFRLEGSRPVWHYAVPGGTLEKAVWMEHGQSATWLRYVAHGTGGRLRLAVFATQRDYHHETRGAPSWRFEVTPLAAGAEVTAFAGGAPWRILGPRGALFTPAGDWWWHFLHRREQQRGLDCEEDLYLAGHLEFPLLPGRPALVAITAEPWSEDAPGPDPEGAWERQIARERRLISLAGAQSDPLRARLTLAADQFLVRRGDAPPGEAGTILAGYPWFSDWGRDTMISLPGLTLATGRHSEGRRILTTYARYLDRGMLPNRFPDSGESPEYNTVDATLWFFQAMAAYVDATRDVALIQELYPALADVIAWHLRGTRYGIGMDPADGLLSAGEAGCQLTWMDAKVGDWVVTPRIGKPVEINALWYNALRHMDAWARQLGRPAGPPGTTAGYADLAERVRESFNARFWYQWGDHLYDVIDTPSGHPETALRPNQVFALSLAYPVLDGRRFQNVLGTVERNLLVPPGLRTLAPNEQGYQGYYAGDQFHRDAAYHQGTAWAWTLGAFLDGRRRLGATAAEVEVLCRPLADHLREAGVGSISEVFDGNPPFLPGGCPFQAWSVAEILRALGGKPD